MADGITAKSAMLLTGENAKEAPLVSTSMGAMPMLMMNCLQGLQRRAAKRVTRLQVHLPLTSNPTLTYFWMTVG